MSKPIKAFTNIPANTTTASFVLPAGVGEMQVKAVDQNNPGTVALLDSNSATVTSTSSSLGEFMRGWGFGEARFMTAGGTYTISTTADTQNVTIYFDEAY